MFDVSAVLLQNALEMPSPLTDACETFRHIPLHNIKSPTSTKFAAVQADRVWRPSPRLSTVDFIQQAY